MSEESTEQPKIIVDDDWKSRAEAEKQQLEEQLKEKRQSPGSDQVGELPPPSLAILISTLATQAMACLGRIPDPDGKLVKNLQLAKHHIDMLGVLQEKTQGNLTAEEGQMLENVLHELRMDYVAGGYHPPAAEPPEPKKSILTE